MTRSRTTSIPTEPRDVAAWANDFNDRHGLPPFAGGEALGGTGGVTIAPPPAATPAPAAAEGQSPGGAQPGAAPGAPQQQPGAPAPDAGAQQAEQQPAWVDTLLERMDQAIPSMAPDPLAVELGLVDAPPAPYPGQPGFDPSQAAQQGAALPPGYPGAAQPLPGQPGLPQAMPGQLPPGMPGQPQPGVPGQQPDQYVDVLRQFVDERAQEIAQRMVQGTVEPYMQMQDQQRRRSEAEALVDDYPQLRDAAYSQELVTRARQWGQQILGNPAVAGEPGWLELVHLASQQLAAAQGQQPAPQPGVNGEVPIEAPGGANPGGAASQSTEIADRIAAASPRRGLTSLWQ